MIQSEKGAVPGDRDACLTDIERSVVGGLASGGADAERTPVVRGSERGRHG